MNRCKSNLFGGLIPVPTEYLLGKLMPPYDKQRKLEMQKHQNEGELYRP